MAGFNEAAANGRGNTEPPPLGRLALLRFNEAAANGRGNFQEGVSSVSLADWLQ